MAKDKVKVSARKAAFVDLSDFCVMSMGDNKDRGDYLEVTQWTNGEGFDIEIYAGKDHKTFQLTDGQIDAIKACIKLIYK